MCVILTIKRLPCTSKIFLFSIGDSQRAAEITRSLGEMIVKGLQPISIVEDKGFNAFVKTLDPHYKIPSCKHTMEGTITDLYNSCKEKVKAALQRAHSVVLTTDMWTLRSTEAYLTVSSHFIDNWQSLFWKLIFLVSTQQTTSV